MVVRKDKRLVETVLAPSPLAPLTQASDGDAASRVSTLLFLQVVNFALQSGVAADQSRQVRDVDNPGGGVGG
jgi:hypothetical protein